MNSPVDMTMFITPKSDQLNADDLIGGPRTITVTKVSANQGSAEQPVSIYFDGDNGKPYKPCKSMRRVLVHIWGSDARNYIGRSMTLYCDPGVQFGGMKVGGIRISHMSHIDAEKTMALTATRSKRAPYTVHPLKAEPLVPTVAEYEACDTLAKLAALEERRREVWDKLSKPLQAELRNAKEAAKARIVVADRQTSEKPGELPISDDAAIVQLVRAATDDAALTALSKQLVEAYSNANREMPLPVNGAISDRREVLKQF